MDSSNRSTVARLIAALAEAENDSEIELDVPLYEALNVGALDLLESVSGSVWELSFQYDGKDVVVSSTGLITVDGVEYGGAMAPNSD